MSWVRTSDDEHEWPAVSALSDAAFRLRTSAREYACRALSDGYVPVDQPARLVRLRHPKKAVLELLEANLWHEAARPCTECVAERERAKAVAPAARDGYLIHGFFPDQQPRHKVIAEREAARRRMDRLRGADVRPNNGPMFARTNGERTPVVRPNERQMFGDPVPRTTDLYRSVGYGEGERTPDVRANIRRNTGGLRKAGELAERLKLDLSAASASYPHDRVDAISAHESLQGSTSESARGEHG